MRIKGSKPGEMNWLFELEPVDRAAFRRFYRIIRIAVYAKQSCEYGRVGMYQGCYGKSREDAKAFIVAFAEDINHLAYIGSK